MEIKEQCFTAFFSSYLQCAAWSSTDEDGESMDHLNFSDEAENTLKVDAQSFFDALWELDEDSVNEALYREWTTYTTEFNWSQAGHDFWLTRNGHGAGFWDRIGGERFPAICSLANSYGECALYVNAQTWNIEVC